MSNIITSSIVMQEHAGSILGVPGRFMAVVQWENGSLANQKWISEARQWTEGEDRVSMSVEIRFDDNCRNGHASFAITGDGKRNGRWDFGGCCHDEIAQRFPELKPLIKWHLCSTDGPMHYVANTLHHAGDRDCWEALEFLEALQRCNPHFERYATTFSGGKARDLDVARSSAIWPEATDEELSQEPEALKAALVARLPALKAAFRADIEACGFIWPSAE